MRTVGQVVRDPWFWLVLAALALSLLTAWKFRADMQAKGATRMWEFQRTRDRAKSRAIWDAWGDDGRQKATLNLKADNRFLVAYNLAYALLGILVIRLLGWEAAWGAIALVVSLAAVAAFCDYQENDFQLQLIRNWDQAAGTGAVEKVWVASTVKLCVLLVLLPLTLVWFVVADRLSQPVGQASRFADLYRLEQREQIVLLDEAIVRVERQIEIWGEHDPDVVKALRSDLNALHAVRSGRQRLDETEIQTGPSGEPWVSYTPVDCVGLALSGGGIRSATFNLGLLQGLHDSKLLPILDYLSTVSGGGYVGGWWSAWRARNPAREFPESTTRSEPEEVRHLREFSNFLAPRWGLFETEMWNGFVAILSAMVPSLLVAISLIGIGWICWLAFAGLLWRWSLNISFATLIATTLALELGFELVWWHTHKSEERLRSWYAFAVGTAVAVLALSQFWPVPLLSPLEHESLRNSSLAQWLQENLSSWTWWKGPRLFLSDATGRGVDLWLFNPACAWLLAAVVLVALRFLLRGALAALAPIARWVSGGWSLATVIPPAVRRTYAVGFDRVTGRLLGFAVVWTVLSLLWQLGRNFAEVNRLAQALIVGGPVVGSGLLALLRNWIVQQLRAPQRPGMVSALKPLIPQALAYLTIAMAAVTAIHVLCTIAGSDWSWWRGTLLALLGVVGVVLVFFHPNRIGLHAFCRSRIARAYLGASNRAASPLANRETDERADDDLALSAVLARPLHLICCAANDLSGDPLENLGRGSRSAVLSRYGLAMRHDWSDTNAMSCAAALTASAAAFNSNMGSVSTQLGRAVCFLMSALNLRLGLWVPHPRLRPIARLLPPGWWFLREMFGWTASGNRPDGRSAASYVHLSDGAHFENLGLYELIRRHCRYVIVSDCGQDPEVAFDDFGNALRRIREDFGIEIEIDLEPLKSDAKGLARQHMVVGTINYDRHSDKGTLLYFKPTLTGDETYDVCQYETRNSAFPHETTADQFYDEAQWESYRRLGEHSARSGLRFVEKLHDDEYRPAVVFAAARREWYPSPPDLEEQLLKLTQRYSELERQLRDGADPQLVHELFPELDKIATHAPLHALQPATQISTLHFLLQMTQLMEDAWIGCYLDTHWGHPLNLGWVNLFHRWIYAPSFQMWWPLIKPLYGSGLRFFVDERLPFIVPWNPVRDGQVRDQAQVNQNDLAWLSWCNIKGGPPNAQKRLFAYEIELRYRGAPLPLQIGLVQIDIDGGAQCARWVTTDFFTPPGLWGAGIGIAFLRKLLDRLNSQHHITRCDVILPPPTKSDAGSRQEHVDLIDFYSRAGFQFARSSPGAADRRLVWTR